MASPAMGSPQSPSTAQLIAAARARVGAKWFY